MLSEDWRASVVVPVSTVSTVIIPRMPVAISAFKLPLRSSIPISVVMPIVLPTVSVTSSFSFAFSGRLVASLEDEVRNVHLAVHFASADLAFQVELFVNWVLVHQLSNNLFWVFHFVLLQPAPQRVNRTLLPSFNSGGNDIFGACSRELVVGQVELFQGTAVPQEVCQLLGTGIIDVIFVQLQNAQLVAPTDKFQHLAETVHRKAVLGEINLLVRICGLLHRQSLKVGIRKLPPGITQPLHLAVNKNHQTQKRSR